MKPGDTVTIYIHPETQTLEEGSAKLIKHVEGDTWLVEFEDQLGQIYYRKVSKPSTNN